MKRRAVVIWAGRLVVTILAVEGISFVGYRILTSEFFSYSTVSENRRTVLAETVTVQPATEMRADVRGWTFSNIILHPFLGYTVSPKPKNTGYPFSQTTIHTEAGHGTDNRKVIGITGGSVAEGFYQHAEKTPEFRRELEKLPAFQGKEIEFVLLGLRGYKQPQQLLAVTYYLSLNEPLDILINFDGWNEIALGSQLIENGNSPVYPFRWSELTDDQITIEHLASAGRISFLENLRHRIAGMADHLSYSVTAQLFWQLSDFFLRYQTAQVRVDMSEPDEDRPFFRAGPAFDGDLADFYKWSASLWARASADLYRLSKSRGFEYLHFLQPSPCLSKKTLSEWEEREFSEKSCVWCQHIVAGYPELQRESRQLNAREEFYFDFTGVFQSIVETSYLDACAHLNNRGYDVVATEMARIIKQRLSARSRSAERR